MKTICELNRCTGCMACINVCSQTAIRIEDTLEAYNAVVDIDKCVNCELCEKICPVKNPQVLNPPIYWKQGWAKDEIRSYSSSGGAASALMQSFISDGGYVASCLFENGEFKFAITNDIDRAKRFAGSKYVKSNAGFVYREINQQLKQGKKVLFVGLPCQSAAAKSFCGKHDNFYSIDLICHGTPTPKLLKRFFEEYGMRWDNIKDIKFRVNNSFGLVSDGARLTPANIQDNYSRAFLRSIDYTENCYFCKYATLNRVSDITLGDAWGQLSDIDKDGVSLILCQTKKGKELVEHSGLHLEDVNLEKAIKANGQLNQPSTMHPGRAKFFKKIKKGYSINQSMFFVFPKESIKQSIKVRLIKMHLDKIFSTTE